MKVRSSKVMFIALVCVATFLFSCRPSSKSAAQYNNKIITHQVKIVEVQKQLNESINKGKAEEMKAILNKFKAEIKNESDSIAAIDGFDGKDNFKKITLNYLNELSTLSDNEYSSLVKMYEIPDSTFTRDDEKKAQDLLTLIQSKTDNAFKALEAEQVKFANEYNFQVEKK